MSELKFQRGEVLRADKLNQIVDRLPVASPLGEPSGIGGRRMRLCKTTEAIAAAVIDETDITDSVYEVGLVETYVLTSNGDGTFSPTLTADKRLMINPSLEEIPINTELWATETFDGYLVATIWVC